MPIGVSAQVLPGAARSDGTYNVIVHFGPASVAFVYLAIGGFKPLTAQDSAGAPAAGLVLHDKASIGSLIVERWIRPGDIVPEAFIEHRWYEHATVLMQDKPVLTLSTDEGKRYRIDEHSGTDINGDGIPDLIVEEYSGGAHCCSSTVIYAVRGTAKPYFHVDTEHCGGQLEDLDHDGRMEFVTCDAGFAYQYCVYSDSPRPNVVYGYDPNRGTYVPDTPRFAGYLQGDIETDVQAAEAEMRKPEEDRDSATCVVLRPVLETIYRTGKFDGGLELLRRLYGNESDYPEVQKSIVETIKASQHFASR